MGIGKLYKLSDNKLVGKVYYRLFHHEAATNWWGELTLIDNVHINEGDQFKIILEDKRKSKCHLKKRINRAVSGIPPHYIYHVTGFSPLE